jgi:hypothetical protein
MPEAMCESWPADWTTDDAALRAPLVGAGLI